jgi:hypothetical protein
VGDANKEIAFGGVTAGVLAGCAAGAITHAVDPDEGPTLVVGSLVGLAVGVGATAYLWKNEKTPGSWVNPVLAETIPATGSDPATTTTVVANPTPPTPLGTTVAFLEILGTLAGAIAAVSVINDWSKKRTGVGA